MIGQESAFQNKTYGLNNRKYYYFTIIYVLGVKLYGCET